MSIASPDAVYRKLADNPKIGLKTRIAALEKMSRPSLSLLSRLCRSGKPKLMRVAADRLSQLQKQKDPEQQDAIADLLK